MIILSSHLISVMINILQISLFNEEMAKLGSSVKSMQRKCRLTDDDKELASFRRATDEVGRNLKDIKLATKVCTLVNPMIL